MYYYAPLEGITDAAYRRIHASCFGGIDKYFIPFISPTQDKTLPPREMRAVAPEVNRGIYAVPQILTRSAELFLWAAGQLAEMGYAEVNLNLGCPSGTVTAKGKGAGMLTDPSSLCAFLDEIYSRTPIPVSIKTRIGFASTEEWEDIFDVFSRFPVHELIVHPRTRQEFYRGDVHLDIYQEIEQRMSCPLVYNGNLFSLTDITEIRGRIAPSAWMLARGIAANPALAREAAGGAPIEKEELYAFHNALFKAYSEQYSEHIVLGKMREIVKYLSCCFLNTRKIMKALFKAQHTDYYLEAVDALMHLELRNDPGYLPAGQMNAWP